MIWEQLCKDFEFIVAWDTEFKGDMLDHGELNEPVCSVFKELKTGTITKHFGKTLDALPYPSDKTLYIALSHGLFSIPD
jgi:hypothetical protein